MSTLRTLSITAGLAASLALLGCPPAPSSPPPSAPPSGSPSGTGASREGAGSGQGMTNGPAAGTGTDMHSGDPANMPTRSDATAQQPAGAK